MILLCGIPSEDPVRRVCAELRDLGRPYVLFNQRGFQSNAISLGMTNGKVSGYLSLEGRKFQLDDFKGIFLRLMDHQLLPEMVGKPLDSPARGHCAHLHELLVQWIEITSAPVLNRPTAMSSNGSKPYQAQIIKRAGFSVPETIISNRPERVREFVARHRRVIYKSISGIRSVVRTFEETDLERLGSIRSCPTQFQAYVRGTDVRVHAVGGTLFPTAVRSNATDYRYAAREGADPATFEPTTLEPDIAARCIRLSHLLDLPLAGIDLKITPDGEVFCFEVNPCPGFTYYESHTGQPIARAIARYLAGSS